MLHIDVLSSYVSCGAGALVGGAMVRLARTDDPQLRLATTMASLSLIVLGVSLGQVVFQQEPLARLALYLMMAGTLVCLVLFDGTVCLLGGLVKPRWQALLAKSVLCLLFSWACLHLEAGLQAQLYALVFALLATLCGVHVWPLLVRPRDRAETAFALAVSVFVVSSWCRGGLAFLTPGPPPTHLLYVPPALMPPFAVLYSVLPIVVSTAVLHLLNHRLHRKLSQQASTDELTGVLTRRALRELAPRLLERHAAGPRNVAALMLDIDHFKSINDRFGHATGDLVLQTCGRLLQAQLRADVLLARYGGEEFVVLAPVQDLRGARLVAERLREAVATGPWRHAQGQPLAVTVSVGCALIGPAEALDDAIRRADEALYRAKGEGRNQVQVALNVA